ncbi:MAG: PQQ-binding-like beta-propeller repeat protein [Gemmatimonadaceae bacterium]
MARRRSRLIHVGIKHTVLALDETTGAEVWRVKLKGGDFVAVHRNGDRVFAANRGEVFCLDAETGAQLWHNTMKGLGLGLATFATESAAPAAPAAYVSTAEAQRKREAARHAAAT